MHLCQIATSVADGRRSLHFYRDVLGFGFTGGTKMFRGPLYSRIQGLPNVASTCRWLAGDQNFFQFEQFEFSRPLARPLPEDFRVSDIGYTRISLEVPNLGGALRRCTDAGHAPLEEPTKIAGALRACVRDPDGVYLELIEAPARGPRVTGVGLTVPDLSRARRFFVDTVGLAPSAEGAPEREALWGLQGAKRRHLALGTDNILMELSEYPGLSRPRRIDHRLSDQGILNIALGFRSKRQWRAAYKRIVAAGYRPNSRPVDFGFCGVVYVNDDQGFNLELMYAHPAGDRFIGFKPPPRWLAGS